MTIKEKAKQFLSQNNKKVTAVFIMTAMGLTSAISVSALSRDVNIKDGNTVMTTRTIQSDINKILDNVKISVSNDDKVETDYSVHGVINIDIKRAFTVNLNIGNEIKEIKVNDGTVCDLLKSENIILPENKTTNIPLSTKLQPNMNINIVDLINITLDMDGDLKPLQVPMGSLEDALAFSGITLNETYVTSVNKDAIVENGMIVIAGPLEEKNEEEIEQIPFNTVQKNTDTLLKGKTKIEQNGSNGEKLVLNKRKYIAGKLVKSERVSESVIKQPVDQVKLLGTKVEPVVKNSTVTVNTENKTLTDSNGNVLSYAKVIKGTCTAYSNKFGKTTSTGRVAKRGVIAVNPKIIPYGTKVYIKSPDGRIVYGHAVAGDTGGFTKHGNVLADLCYDSESECDSFGRRQMEIYILN